MNILRLSTLSLTLAIAVITLGYNPSFADKPESGDCGQVHCDHGEELGDLTYTVDLNGPNADLTIRGAFEFDVAGVASAVSATLEDKGRTLKGDVAVRMVRPSDPSALLVWEDVFNLCGLLGQWNMEGPDDMSMPTNVAEFTVLGGNWSVSNSSERQFISFGFELDENPPSDNRLSASLTLSRACASVALCRSNVPTASGEIWSELMTDTSVHLTGKKGITHKAFCHGDDDMLFPSGSTLVITAN